MTRLGARARQRLWVGASALGLAGLCACAGGAKLADWVYGDAHVRYRVGALPSTWRAIDVPEGQVSFHDARSGATILALAECRRGDAPLAARRGHLLIGWTERKLEREERFNLDGREALRTRLRASLDGVPRALEIVVVKKDTCSFDFVYSAPLAQREAGRADFDAFVRGFAKLPRETP